MSQMGSDYHSTRLKEDERRNVLWSVLAKYLQRFVPGTNAAILDFGAGYCGFINEIRGERKYAFDQWDGIRQHVAAGVEPVVGHHYERLREAVPDSSLDVVFASNVFEHFSTDELLEVVPFLATRMRTGGRLILVQPNFYYAYRQYFDDFTHKSIWTHASLPDFLATQGFDQVHVKGNFLPLTVKSRLPVNSLLIKAYLMSPIRPMAGQMLVVMEKR